MNPVTLTPDLTLIIKEKSSTGHDKLVFRDKLRSSNNQLSGRGWSSGRSLDTPESKQSCRDTSTSKRCTFKMHNLVLVNILAVSTEV